MKNEKQIAQEQEIIKQVRKPFSFMTIFYAILVFNASDIIHEMRTVSDFEPRAIDWFMLVMGAVSLVFIVINIVRGVKDSKENDDKNSQEEA